MATKKAPAKIAKKPVPKSAPVKGKIAAKEVKKAAPVKKAVVKQPAPKVAPKKAVKPLAKVPVKAVAKKVVKKVAKPMSKVLAKSANKVIAKPLAKKALLPPKPEKKLSKKIEARKIVAKAAPAKKATVKIPEKVVAAPKVAAKTVSKVAPAKPLVQKPVVLPKINTKTSRKYEPDFTKSVLDKAPADPGARIVMYSDADLAEFKELIQRKLGSAKKELAYLQGLITRKDAMGGDEGDGRYMTMEDGSLSMEREQLSQMASRQITFVDHLEKALIRIENKTYGVCRITGKLIDKARLRAVPHATLSIEAKMGGGK
ncbi:MAG: TraR/DksA family transcriptional regulator [Ferruginibacter sp.]